MNSFKNSDKGHYQGNHCASDSVGETFMVIMKLMKDKILSLKENLDPASF